jgi:hypothetical protein
VEARGNAFLGEEALTFLFFGFMLAHPLAGKGREGVYYINKDTPSSFPFYFNFNIKVKVKLITAGRRP